MSATAAVSFSGLVSSQTSGKPPEKPLKNSFELDTNLNRWKKLRRAVRESARLHELEAQGRKYRPVMLTLTYAEVDAQQPRDLSECLRHIRNWMKARGERLRYVWVAELQKRGALHYHVIIWVPSRLYMPRPDEAGWWKHGSTGVDTSVRTGVGYMTKYASKIRSKMKAGVPFPKGFRMHGCGGLSENSREFRMHHLRPQWLRDLTQYTDRIRPLAGGGFVSKVTGEIFESPFVVIGFRFLPGIGPQVLIKRKE